MSRGNNILVGSLCVLGGAVMFSIPYYMRQTTEPLDKRSKMSGSQRQRGLYMNTGSQDAGPDPDWDPITNKWKGYEKKNRESTSSSSSSTPNDPPPTKS